MLMLNSLIFSIESAPLTRKDVLQADTTLASLRVALALRTSLLIICCLVVPQSCANMLPPRRKPYRRLRAYAGTCVGAHTRVHVRVSAREPASGRPCAPVRAYVRVRIHVRRHLYMRPRTCEEACTGTKEPKVRDSPFWASF